MSPWGLEATPVFVDEAIPRGEVLVDDEAIWMSPYAWLLYKFNGRLPFETRHTLGVRELERDRRRNA